MTTVADLLGARAEDDGPGLRYLDQEWTWRAVVQESRRRAALARSVSGKAAPHVGVLLDNVPEYLFWLGGAALAGAVVVGVNPTRRGDDLARDIRFTECDLVVTDAAGAVLLEGLDTGVPPARLVRVDEGTHAEAGGGDEEDDDAAVVAPESLYLLLFTSGTTAAPKAVRCTQGRLAAIAGRVVSHYGFRRDDVCYCPMPLFHGNAVMSLWAPAVAAGACVALGGRFSASRFSEDVRRYGATRFTYVGKALAYVLATPPRPGDAASTLQTGFGTEASERDRREFEARFGCTLVEGYGSSEGGVAVNRTADTPPGALGPAGTDVAVVDPTSGEECPRAVVDAAGRVANAEEATGEIVNRSGAGSFEGYWKHPEADARRVRDGWYWTGDLGYVDEAGFLWFAGRSEEWLRVDSENVGCAPIERILGRHPRVVAAAVYAVPDTTAGDQVMAALELSGVGGDGLAAFGAALGAWLDAQPDLGTKWAPRFVRVVDAMPLVATGKVTKAPLRAAGWWDAHAGTVLYRVARSGPYRVMGREEREDILGELERHGRRPPSAQ